MNENITTLDTKKIGTKGYPRSWKELGFEPPLKEIQDPKKINPTDTDIQSQNQP